MHYLSPESDDATQQPDALLAQVPRHVAAAINPLISESHAHNTMEAVADLIEDLGFAAYVNDPEADAATGKELHHRVANVAVTALRYEAALAVRQFRRIGDGH